jgi:hypothetical protein
LKGTCLRATKYVINELIDTTSGAYALVPMNRFTTESFWAHGAASPYFSPMERISNWIQSDVS